MILLIDIGNTRTKWALAANEGAETGLAADASDLSEFDVCMNGDLPLSALQKTAIKAKKVVVANVAGEAMAKQLGQLLLRHDITFVETSLKACGVTNSYIQPEKLGADRWAALVAAWHLSHQSTIVVNAGTAITIDVLNDQGVFLGGTIMPGLQLMRTALSNSTAKLNLDAGEYALFPNNTQNAIETGCMNAAIGGIRLMVERIQALQSEKGRLILTGGDASKLLAGLGYSEKQDLPNKQHSVSRQDLLIKPNQQKKQVIIKPYFAPHLVLQGLLLLERERV